MKGEFWRKQGAWRKMIRRQILKVKIRGMWPQRKSCLIREKRAKNSGSLLLVILNINSYFSLLLLFCGEKEDVHVTQQNNFSES